MRSFYIKYIDSTFFHFTELFYLISLIAQVIAVVTGFSSFVWKFFAIIKVISFGSILFSGIYSRYWKTDSDEIYIREIEPWTDIVCTIVFLFQKP